MSKYAKDVLLVVNEIEAINLVKFGVEDAACKIVPYDSDFLDHNDPVIQKLKNENMLSGEHVLMRSPYSLKKYYLLEDFDEIQQLKYFEKFTYVCALLGVTSVDIEKIYTIKESHQTNVEASAGGKYQGITANAETEVEVIDGNFKRSCIGIASKMFAKKDLEAAKKLIEEYDLENDGNIQDLVKAISMGVELIEKRIDVNVASQIMKRRNIVANVSTKLKVVDCSLKSSLSKHSSIKEAYSLKLCLKFGNQ